MGVTKEISLCGDESSKAAFVEFRNHCDGHRVDTGIMVLELIRKTHPGFHVTLTPEDSCSLLEYASTGKAEAILDADEEILHAVRRWSAVGRGVDKQPNHPGTLDDHPRFARYKYIWEGKEFIVYQVLWSDPQKMPEKNFYVLSARSETNISGVHCTDTDALVLAAGKWTSELHDEIFVFDDAYWSKSKSLWKSIKGSSWDDVILDADTKKSIIEDVMGFFDSRELYREFAVPWKRGIILHGVPGNGKTISIKSLINALHERPEPIPSLYVKSFQNCRGEQYAIRQIFTRARTMAPCLLIFEDLDSLVIDKCRSYFLNEVDGLESNDGILMIGSTNHLNRLDPAIAKRPSRFDRKYHYKLPGDAERTAYADYWRKKLEKNARVEFPKELCTIISKLTESFSFAYLKELFVMALLSVARGGTGEEEEPFEEVQVPTGNTSDEEDAKPIEAEPKAANGQANQDGESLKETKEAKKPIIKRTIPEVMVPDHLAHNVLLKVIKHQIKILFKEMDNTDEDEWPTGQTQVGESTGDYGKQLRRLEAANRRRALG